MRRFMSLFIVAALLGLSTAAQAELRSYNVPAMGKSIVDSLTFSKNGAPSRVDCLIGAADKDTTTNLIPLAGLKSWSVSWIYTDSPGPATNTTWAVRCTLQVSNDSTNWHQVSPGAGVWALTASSDTNMLQILYNHDLADSAVGLVNGPGVKRAINAARFARFVVTVANSADDTVYLKAIQSRLYGD